jgi:hypothetical protein
VQEPAEDAACGGITSAKHDSGGSATI